LLPWKTVFHYFRRWRMDGIWEGMNRALQRTLREQLGPDPEPRAGIVDSQSVKTKGVGGEQRGFDGRKKVRGSLSATSSWIPRGWWSKPASTAPRSRTGTA
jgi:transposase